MSVVAVRVNTDFIEIASDSILVKGNFSKRIDREFHKLYKVNNMVIGSVGSAEEMSLFSSYCELHSIKAPTTNDVLNFICEFIKWKEQYGSTQGLNNQYIIIFKDKAFSIENLFIEEITKYDAIGAGEDFAMAALYLGHSAEEAVKVSCDLCCYVSEPIVSFKVPIKNK